MARRCCRLRNILICVCTPCFCLALLLTYISVMVCLNMTVPANSQLGLYFVAPGTVNNGSFAPLPKTFWKHHLDSDAFWNQLQQLIDYDFNPILRPRRTKARPPRSRIGDSLLRQSFSEVTLMDNMLKNFEKFPKQIQEFVSYMQRRNYPILIQPDGVCGAKEKDEREPPMILLAIKTTELSLKNRQAIRQTWGRVGWVVGQKTNSSSEEVLGGYVRRVFLLGKADNNQLSQSLKTESKLYGDILQWDFKDTFFNLTLKDVLFWSWFSRHCDRVHFVFKGDDDVFVNVPKLITYLQSQLKKSQALNTLEDFMVGEVIGSAKPNRVKSSKYFIPDTFYKGFYPLYPGGGGLVYSGLLAKRLDQISKTVHLFPIDDVYVGMCMIRLNALPVHNPAFLTFDFPENEGKEPCSYHTILMVHKRTPEQIVSLWADVQQTQRQCQDVPLRSADKKINAEDCRRVYCGSV
ncbi:N-acetyllactosaminide beta-1,3-N-acetylglucosaminyltransferase 2 isoform 1-T2 [Odontesthes bonariensis]|uniref:N-acetyllactosaminide beta-1,3-N-acetylglucosaminyltransferase 2 n=1 Tax=Odontesthes bonariensis TaxID=219752 RepID=UPI003F58AB51